MFTRIVRERNSGCRMTALYACSLKWRPCVWPGFRTVSHSILSVVGFSAVTHEAANLRIRYKSVRLYGYFVSPTQRKQDIGFVIGDFFFLKPGILKFSKNNSNRRKQKRNLKKTRRVKGRKFVANGLYGLHEFKVRTVYRERKIKLIKKKKLSVRDRVCVVQC